MCPLDKIPKNILGQSVRKCYESSPKVERKWKWSHGHILVYIYNKNVNSLKITYITKYFGIP